MKKLGKILLITFVVLVLLLVAGISLTIGWRPFIGPRTRPLTSRQFERTPQRLERGRYLATSLTGCMDCHSQRDWTKHGGPIVAGTEGRGEPFPLPGFPGTVVAPNITPDPATGAGNWTDDQLARAIREGIAHDGGTLFPLMPYLEFARMSDEDLASIVVYIRSLPAINHAAPPTQIQFPVKYLIRNTPQPITGTVSSPNPADKLKWGEYLVQLGGCQSCHTPQSRGQAIAGMAFGGGQAFQGPWGTVSAANITPNPSGISYYDETLFIQALRTGYVKARELKAIMPYGVYGNLTDDDLKAMYAYLRTLAPVTHRVDNSLPATYCKLCRMEHGAGNQN